MSIETLSQQFYQQLSSQLLQNITEDIQRRVVVDVAQIVAHYDVNTEIRRQIVDLVGRAAEKYQLPDRDLNQPAIYNGIVAEFRTRTEEFVFNLIKHVEQTVLTDMYDRLKAINVEGLIREHTGIVVGNLVNNVSFPQGSIDGASVNPTNLKVSANNITPGIISNFESTGIQDGASRCQVTILDAATVVENKLVSHDLEVAGRAVFAGEVEFNAALPDSSPFIQKIVSRTVDQIESKFDGGVFDLYCDRVIDRINTDGLPSTVIRANGHSLVVDGKLANNVVESNLQKVGALRELQVVGETLLDETVYVSNKRVGINTMEPERTLDLWDQEVQITAGKKMKDVAVFGTPRNQALIISAANREQLTVNTDGSVTIAQLNINRVRHSSSPQEPRDNRPPGFVVWNEQPQIGLPIGWVSLGGARWARFGIITE